MVVVRMVLYCCCWLAVVVVVEVEMALQCCGSYRGSRGEGWGVLEEGEGVTRLPDDQEDAPSLSRLSSLPPSGPALPATMTPG